MIVIPAIDLRGGRAVRLVQGDPARGTVVGEDPLEAARGFEAEGAERLHVVDLDAALGTGSNPEAIARIVAGVGVPVQVGGGLRSLADVERVLADGADRAILGTAAALDPAFVTAAVERAGDRVVVAADVRGHRMMVRGWTEEGPAIDDAFAALAAAGAPRFLVTSVERDGTLDGPDLDLYRRILNETDRPMIASGGVRERDDVEALAALGLEAVVVGTALYSGALRLAEVVGR